MADSSTAPFSLAGRTALVTGSSTGLGKAMATCLGLAGAKVAMNYANNAARAEAAQAELSAAGVTAGLFKADVTSEAEIDEMFTAIEGSLGPVDIVVVNATPPQPQKPIEEYDWDFYQQMLDFFVKSPYLLARRALPGMKSRRHGRLVNMTSEVFHLGRLTLLRLRRRQGRPDGLVAKHVPRARPVRDHGQHDRPRLDPGGAARWRSAGRQGRLSGEHPDGPLGHARRTSAGRRSISPATRRPS